MKSLLRRAAYALVVLGVIVVLVLVWKRPRTPAIRGLDGEPIATGVADLEAIDLGGFEQWVLVRGDAMKPALLFLHGGPGMPAMYLAHAFQRPLERDFLVVHWDQRGAGKSFAERPPVESMRVSRLLADAEELLGWIESRYGKREVLLVGHSWGSVLGSLLARRRPERILGYVGVGQVVHGERADSITDRWLRQRARELGREEAIEELDARGTAVHEKWLFEFGGELHRATSYWPLVRTGFGAPEYSLVDVFRVKAGSSWSSTHMRNDVLDGPLLDRVRDLSVPVWILQGRYDYVTPTELAAEWLERLDAPRKELVVFEESAHFPLFEEPERFHEELLDIGRTLGL